MADVGNGLAWTRSAAAVLILSLSACVEPGADYATTGSVAAPLQSSGSTARTPAASGLRRARNDPQATLGMAEAALGEGKLTRAAQLFDLADQGTFGPIARSLQGRGLIALRRGQNERAIRLLRDALDAEAGLWRAEIGLARAHLALNQPVSAMVALEGAEKSASQNPSALNDIGMVFLSDKVPERALDYFERALVLDETHAAARSNIRIARAMLGDYDAAVAGVSPEDAADALNNAGYAAILNGAYETADRLLRRALQISPVYHAAARANLDLLNQATAGAVARGAAEARAPEVTRSTGRKVATTPSASAETAPPAVSAGSVASPVVETAVLDPGRLSEDSGLAPRNTYRWAQEPLVMEPAMQETVAERAATDTTEAPQLATIDDGGYRWAN